MKEKKFICWYAFKDMETEGRLVLEEPKIIGAKDIAEAMWKYHNFLDPGWGEKFFDGDINKWKEKGEFQGWEFRCEELAN